MNIVCFEVMPGEEEALTALLPSGHQLTWHTEPLSRATVALAKNADIVSVFVKSELSAPLLDQLPDLKLITTRSMGYDHIDVAHARTRGVRTTNVTTYASHPVAEFTFALLLNVTRRIYPAYNQLREGTNFDIRGLKGLNLFGKTLGVAGTGRIGKNVIAIARGFGMNVIAYDTMPDQVFSTQHGFQYVSLEDLISKSDIISLHIPLTPETRHIINGDMFARMKKGVVIINTSRGDVIDTHALVAALRDGTVWGAGLDVLESERELHNEVAEVASDAPNVDYKLLAANHILIDMPNVIVTPHIAFETTEAMAEIARATAESISNFIAGKEQSYL